MPEDRGLGQRLAGQTRDHALIRQQIRQRRGLGVQAAAHPIARWGGGVVRRLRMRSVGVTVDEGVVGRPRSARRSWPCVHARPA